MQKCIKLVYLFIVGQTVYTESVTPTSSATNSFRLLHVTAARGCGWCNGEQYTVWQCYFTAEVFQVLDLHDPEVDDFRNFTVSFLSKNTPPGKFSQRSDQ